MVSFSSRRTGVERANRALNQIFSTRFLKLRWKFCKELRGQGCFRGAFALREYNDYSDAEE